MSLFTFRLRVVGLLWVSVGGLATGLGLPGMTAAMAAPPTYHEHVAPVLIRHCSPCHHPGGSAPFALETYADARKHVREIVELTGNRRMPPWPPAAGHGEFLGERRLADAEIARLREWAETGTIEGDPTKGVAAPARTGAWDLGEPDLVVRMPAAYTVKPADRDEYRNFVLPVKLDRRRYVAAWQFRPHSRAVHHMFLRLDKTGEGRRRDEKDAEPGFPGMDTPTGIESPPGHFASWQPGAAPRRVPPGLYWALDPGVDLVLQMHLQPLGRPEPLQSEVAFYFTDQPPTNQPVKLGLINFGIDLPPGATNFVVSDEFTLPAAADVLGFLPHTHYLGRRVEGRALFPDGSERSLFLIPDWDFNWQGDYICKTPVRLPAGTRLRMEITFDNSADNPRNPFRPPRRVRYGPTTLDEMAELWVQLLPVAPADGAKFERPLFERTLRDSLAANVERLRINPADAAAMVNIGRVHLAQRRPNEARVQFEKAVALDPQYAEAHYYLGLLARISGRKDIAVDEFSRAVQINTNYARAHGNLGLLLVEAERIDAAIPHLQAAAALDPTDAVALSMLGAIELSRGRHREAEQLLSRALALNPGDPEVRQNLTVARQRLGQAPP